MTTGKASPGRRGRARWRVVAAGLLLLGAGTAGAQLSHRPDAMLRSGFESAASGPHTDQEAARFLNQATFGATLDDIAHLRQIGYDAWFAEQFAAAPSYQAPYLDWVSTRPAGQNGVYQPQRLEAWLINAVGLYDPSNPPLVHRDQLRQRVAFALSEIFVVSDQNAGLQLQAWSLASWHDMLADNAFGNYRQLLQDVTLHPAMGVYLSMVGNRKPDTMLNIRPDENFAREILQLFSIGLKQLDSNGVPILVNGQPVPTYNQNTVRGFAHVFTGWNYNNCSSAEYPDCVGEYHDPASASVREAMLPFEAYHDNSSTKQLLIYDQAQPPGGLLAPGTAQAELAAALDNIAGHPNVAPFIARQLIQRLVTSNPSPAYVGRVAAKFVNNGAGVRGDLGAVVKAILLDTEARSGHWGANADRYGKLREPLLKLVQLWRITAPRSTNGRINLLIDPSEWYGQAPLRSPSVFNFFRPSYQPPGEIRDLGLVAPEFQIATDTMLVATPNDLDWRIFYFYIGSSYSYAQDPDQLLMDYGATLNPLAAQPGQLVDRLNLLLMSGQMSPFMRDVLLTRLNALPNNNGGRDRVQHALYLVLNSPEYAIQK